MASSHNQFRTLPREESSYSFDERGGKEKSATLQEIGSQAVWTLSSAKPGFGVEQLRDGNLETYWQSDGGQPHFVNIQFHKRVTVEEVEMYFNYKQDESYTPNKISIRAGTTFHDLKEIKVIDLEEPTGWISIPLLTPNGNKLHTNFVQIAILVNHLNGRDSHLRQIRIYAPRPRIIPHTEDEPDFITQDFTMYSTLR